MLKIFVLLRDLNSGIKNRNIKLMNLDPGIENKGKFKSLPRKISLNYRLKSEIKMDKCKLIQIIEKELEELKILTKEVEESEKDTSLIIEIALSKAKLLCKEMELLRELSAKGKNFRPTDTQEDDEDQIDEDEVSDVNVSDPELEIINSDDEPAETSEEEELDEELEEEEDFVEEDEFIEEEEEPFEEPEIKEGLIEFGVDTDEDIPGEEEEPELPEEPINPKADQPVMVREIEFEDDEDIEPVKSAPVSATTERPVMREIPKPEEPLIGEKIENEPTQKAQSLNDTIGEQKSPESTITSGSITSLRAAIGLNDRFLFIREIFGNNTDKYNTIIDHLDKLETIQQAVDYLKANLTLQKNETSMKFVDLLKRRFTK